MLQPRLYVKLFGSNIHSFHFFGVIGFIIGSFLGTVLCYALHLNVGVIFLMSLIGAVVFLVLALIPKVFTGKETIVYYHHEVAILLACSATLNVMHQPVLAYVDIVLAGVGTFLAFGRIGCFSVGCCHGKPSAKGVRYGAAHVKKGFAPHYKNVALIPVQLIESAFVFLIIIVGVFVVFYYPPGTFLILYTVVYGAFRFCIEFLRGDAGRPYWKGLSEAQWTTLALVMITLVLSFSGKLPLYNWQVIIAAVLLVITLFVAIRRNNEASLLSAKHMAQIAKVLYKFSLDDNGADSLNDEMGLKIYNTDHGLKISGGRIVEGNAVIYHYTLSMVHHKMLLKKDAGKLARIIQHLRRHRSSPQLIKKQAGVFQVVFSEPAPNNGPFLNKFSDHAQIIHE